MKLQKLFAVIMLLFTIISLTACNRDKVELVVCVGSNPDTVDPALNSAVNGATLIIHAFSGLTGYKQNSEGVLEIVPDCAVALPEPKHLSDGKVEYEFTLKSDLKWSDGTALDAHDFEYSWKRAASSELGADYSYLFDIIDGYGTDNLNVKASTDGKKFTVVLKNYVSYFFELCAFPTFMPVKKEVVEANPDGWATKPKTYVGNGPYKMVKWVENSKIVYEKNPYYHNADEVKINDIEFALSDNAGTLLANYKRGTFLFIDIVPNEEIPALRRDYPNEFVVTGQLGTYYICFNVADDTLFGDIVTDEVDKAKVRKALSLLLDRDHIATRIGQAGQIPANSYVPIGLTEPDGVTEFVEKNGPNRNGSGYFSVDKDDYADNCAEAVRLLKEVGYEYDETRKKFTNFPSFTYLTNPDAPHPAIAAYVKEVFEQYGIIMNIEMQEFGTFLNTRKNGDYVLARNGWLADFNDPISFLDMWTSYSGNNDCQLGKGSHANVAIYGENNNQTWAEVYDPIIEQVKSSTNQEERFELMHRAEDLIMSTGAICPIYYYTDLFMVSPKLEGFFTSPLGYKFFMYATVNQDK